MVLKRVMINPWQTEIRPHYAKCNRLRTSARLPGVWYDQSRSFEQVVT